MARGSKGPCNGDRDHLTATIGKGETMSGSETIILVGWGAIGRRLAQLLTQGGTPVRIAAVAVRDAATPRADLPAGVTLIDSPEALADIEAGLVVEAAGRASVGIWGRAAFAAGMDYAVSSTSAFVDEALLAELSGLARASGRQLLIPPGALGGIDALAAAGRLPIASVEHRIVKPASAWQGTPAADLVDLEGLQEATVFFSASAREAADAFPQNANVAVITALAGIGLDRTRISLVADPHAALNRHEIRAEGDFGRMDLTFENRPLATNPKSSEMTALNLARLIENRVTPLVL